MPTSEVPFRCWVEVNLSALRANLRTLRACFKSPGTGVMAVIKADAYGHGLQQVAEALRDEADWFCVANLAEAVAIRATLGGSSPPILILSPLLPEETGQAVAEGFSCTVSSPVEVERLARSAAKWERPARLHAVMDTGMGRMGAQPGEWPELLGAIRRERGCQLEAAATHFSCADEDPEFTRRQIGIFRPLIKGLSCEIHLANSAGILDYSLETSFATLARPGLALYGISPVSSRPVALIPALSLKSRVSLVRQIPAGTTISYGATYVSPHSMKVASVSAGYGDGYPRHLSGSGATVLVRGVRCPLLGRVTMDQVVIDVSHLPVVEPGDECVLIGQQGTDEISAAEIAKRSGTIPWEILTSLTHRATRVYSGKESRQIPAQSRLA